MSDRRFCTSIPTKNSNNAAFCTSCGDGCDLRCGQCTQATMHAPWNQLTAARMKAARLRESLASALDTQRTASMSLPPLGSNSNIQNNAWTPRTPRALVKAAAAEATLTEMRSRVLPALPRKRLALSVRRLNLEKRAAELAEARESLAQRQATHDSLYAVVSEGLARHASNHIAAHGAFVCAQRALSVLELFQLDDGCSSICPSLGGSSEDASSHGDSSVSSSSSSSSGNTTSTSSSNNSNNNTNSKNNTNSSRTPMENCAVGEEPELSPAKLTRGNRAGAGVASVLGVPLPASTSLWPCVPPRMLERALNLVGRCVEATAQALDACKDLPYSTRSYAPSAGAMNAPPLPSPLFMEKKPDEGGTCDAEISGGVSAHASSGQKLEQESGSSFDAAFTELQTNVLHLCFHAKVDPAQLHPDHLVANLCALRRRLMATVEQARADAHHLPLPQLPRPVSLENSNVIHSTNPSVTATATSDSSAHGTQSTDATTAAASNSGVADEEEWEELSNDNNIDDNDGMNHAGVRSDNRSPLSPGSWLENFQATGSTLMSNTRDSAVFAHYENGRAAVGAVANRMTSVLLGSANSPPPQETGADAS